MDNAEDDDDDGTEQIFPNNVDKRSGGDAWDIVAGTPNGHGSDVVIVENVNHLEGFAALNCWEIYLNFFLEKPTNKIFFVSQRSLVPAIVFKDPFVSVVAAF